MASVPTRQFTPRLWFGVAVLACLVVALVVLNWPRPRPKTAIAEAAEHATPEIAALLLEINEVACDLVEQYPNDASAVDVLARLHYRFNRTEEALTYWNQALELDPDYGPANHAIGLLYFERGDHAQAVPYFRKALAIEPQSPTFAVELAQALIAHGQTDEGIAILHKDLVLHPTSVAALAMLGHAHLQKRQFAEAKKYFEQVIALAPEYTNAYHGLTTACANLGEDELAKEYAAQLKKCKERDDEVHRQILKTHDDVRNAKSTLSEIYTAAANVELSHDNSETAEAYLLKAIEMAPNSMAPREILIWLYQIQNRKEDQARALRALVKIVPDRVPALIGCAELCAEIGWIDDAVAAYRRAIELAPGQAGGYLALARLYLQNAQDLPEAKSLAQRAVELEPSAHHYYWLAAACQSNGDKSGALAAIRHAVELEPRNTEYQRALSMISRAN